MHRRQLPSAKRARFQRFGAWLAVVAMGLHLLVMATHRPANAAPARHEAEHCMEGDGQHHGDAPVHDKSGGLLHHTKFCAICQSLQAGGTPLLASCISLHAPIAIGEVQHTRATQLWVTRVGHGVLHLRGPPELRLV